MKKIVSATVVTQDSTEGILEQLSRGGVCIETNQDRSAVLNRVASCANLPTDWSSLGVLAEQLKGSLGYPGPVDKTPIFGKQHTPKRSREMVDVLVGNSQPSDSESASLTVQETRSLKRSARKQALMESIRNFKDLSGSFSENDIKNLLGTIVWRVTGNRVEKKRNVSQQVRGEKSHNSSRGNKDALLESLSDAIARHKDTSCTAILTLLEEGTGNKEALIALYLIAKSASVINSKN